jgi:hypothetical protein
MDNAISEWNPDIKELPSCKTPSPVYQHSPVPHLVFRVVSDVHLSLQAEMDGNLHMHSHIRHLA